MCLALCGEEFAWRTLSQADYHFLYVTRLLAVRQNSTIDTFHGAFAAERSLGNKAERRLLVFQFFSDIRSSMDGSIACSPCSSFSSSQNGVISHLDTAIAGPGHLVRSGLSDPTNFPRL